MQIQRPVIHAFSTREKLAETLADTRWVETADTSSNERLIRKKSLQGETDAEIPIRTIFSQNMAPVHVYWAP